MTSTPMKLFAGVICAVPVVDIKSAERILNTVVYFAFLSFFLNVFVINMYFCSIYACNADLISNGMTVYRNNLLQRKKIYFEAVMCSMLKLPILNSEAIT